LTWLAAAAAVLLVFFYFWIAWPLWGIPFNASRHGPPPLTPPWALECWLWEDDVNTAAFVNELLEGYARHDIPVRTILIDSPWSTRYNDFRVDEARYPDPARFFKNLEDRGYRVVLWMTGNVNRENRDTAIRDAGDWFEAARRNGYLVNGGSHWRDGRWWKGRGGWIDYTNPDARRWWHGLQQPLLDWGVDGWKLDGSDTLCLGALGPIPLPYLRSHRGWITTRDYMDLYAREEYRHGLAHNPEFVVLTRAYDTPYAHPEGFAPHDAAPVTWIGDRHHAWQSATPGLQSGEPEADLMRRDAGEGIEAALRDILLSSQRGYAVVGDDVGGYHGRPVIPPRLYIRWAEFAAFTGLFLNGGHGERRLWLRSPEELAIIRKFAWLHTELRPYLYTLVTRCHEGGPSPIRPEGGDYHYRLGDDLLVAPIYRDSLRRTVRLPPGRWRYFFRDAEVFDGPQSLTRDFPLDEFPVFVRDGAILPFQVERPYTGLGDTASKGLLTLSLYPHGASRVTIQNPDRSGATHVRVAEAGDLVIELDGVPKPHILRVRLPSRPAAVTRDNAPLAEGVDWRYDSADQRLWVPCRQAVSARYRIARPH
jgi:alpha-D-xyloside xylohydrolase